MPCDIRSRSRCDFAQSECLRSAHECSRGCQKARPRQPSAWRASGQAQSRGPSHPNARHLIHDNSDARAFRSRTLPAVSGDPPVGKRSTHGRQALLTERISSRGRLTELSNRKPRELEGLMMKSERTGTARGGDCWRPSRPVWCRLAWASGADLDLILWNQFTDLRPGWFGQAETACNNWHNYSLPADPTKPDLLCHWNARGTEGLGKQSIT